LTRLAFAAALCFAATLASGVADASEGWSEAGTTIEPRAQHTATRLPDGRILIAGGAPARADTPGFDTVETWDPTPIGLDSAEVWDR
jgi:hypothetical protein